MALTETEKALPEHQKILFLCEWPSPGIGCPKRLCLLLRIFKSCLYMLGQGNWTRWSLSFFDSLILWFCNSGILHLRAGIVSYFLIYGRHHETVLAVKMLSCSSQHCIPDFLFTLDILIFQIHNVNIMDWRGHKSHIWSLLFSLENSQKNLSFAFHNGSSRSAYSLAKYPSPLYLLQVGKSMNNFADISYFLWECPAYEIMACSWE